MIQDTPTNQGPQSVSSESNPIAPISLCSDRPWSWLQWFGSNMGVKDLWTVISPVKEQCSLSSLSGKTLAVDLSGWVCQANTTKVGVWDNTHTHACMHARTHTHTHVHKQTNKHTHTACTQKGLSTAVAKPYLRLVFVRVYRFYSEGVNLVFVLDGEAIQLKWSTMDTRSKVGGGASYYSNHRSTGQRSQLNRQIREVCNIKYKHFVM